MTPGGWPPPQPRRSRTGGVLVVVFLVFAGVGLLAVASVMGALSDLVSARPPSAVQSDPPEEPPPPSAAPTVAPSQPDERGLPAREWPQLPAPDSTDPDWVTLQQNPLYATAVPPMRGCPEPSSVTTMTALEEAAVAQMDCIQAAWRPAMASLGHSTGDVPVYFYGGDTVDTPCGEVSAPALYCSAQGGAIYFGEATLNGASWHDFGVKDMAGHEYGHHLQSEAGMFVAEVNVAGGNEAARRLELQATCFAYAMIARDSSFTMTREVYDSFEPYLRAVIEDGIHGSRDSMASWGMRGLYSDTLGNCNTWTADPADVD